ncbi:hypothetical protein Q9R35_08720 [Alcaligenes sp. AB3]|uniref:hypothetical protein n=1 Tax=Alcaligenes sp. AB3 TaxID=2962569 RepID=UPI0028819CED|nr:hypothetical protein [Alcaligenes sp. AB3]MDT0217401.1 hypothetical protein [Alcaligenes sp. AB3]
MMSFTIRSLLIFCLFSFPSLADDRLPLKEGRYTVESTQCEAVDNINTALLSNQHISIAESRCEFSEPTLIGDGEYSLKATCAQPELRAEFLNEAQLKIVLQDRFRIDDGFKLRSYTLCLVEK